MRLTDDQLHTLVAGNPSDHSLLRELRRRTAYAALRKAGNPVGFCAAGLRVYRDESGAYSSGYVCHAKGHTVCQHAPYVWDTDPRRHRLVDLAGELLDMNRRRP